MGKVETNRQGRMTYAELDVQAVQIVQEGDFSFSP
jgi:hypothetical protein